MGTTAKPADKHKIGALTDQMRMFASQYTVDFNGKAAAIRAGYAESSAAAQASKLLAREDVQELVRQKMAQLEKKTEIKAADVLQQAMGIVTADVNDLVEFRRRCCRHCYGIDHGYQRTVPEMSAAKRQHLRDVAACRNQLQRDALGDFDEQGGIGYDARKPPHPDCTSCWGDGIGDAFYKPTANLSPAARALYAGVKQTKDGYQMLLVDKNPSLDKLFRHFGLYEKDNTQQADGLTSLLGAIAARGGKLPIGHKQ
jgi:phage terminase small subunit